MEKEEVRVVKEIVVSLQERMEKEEVKVVDVIEDLNVYKRTVTNIHEDNVEFIHKTQEIQIHESSKIAQKNIIQVSKIVAELSEHLHREETVQMHIKQQREELILMIERVDASMSETRDEFLKLQARTEASVATLQETISALGSKAAAGGSGSLVLLRSLQEQGKVIEKAARH